MTTKTNRITLVMGDPSSDGHGKHEEVQYLCNKTGSEVSKLYSMAVKLHDLDITNECEEYECKTLSDAYRERARAVFGSYPEVQKILDDIDGEEGNVDTYSFSELYLWTAKLMSADLEFERVSKDYTNQLDIGGYGLFWG